MAVDPYKPEYSYVAYVDEAGDPGLKRLRPDDANGSSEWFLLSAVVIDAKYEMAIRSWVQDMMTATRAKNGIEQRSNLHFRNLSDTHKQLVCAMLAAHPVRCFIVASHKKSLLNWPHSPSVRAMRNQDWFYAFLSRYLLERVTHFVGQNSRQRHSETKKVKVVFSERGGLNVGQMAAYYDKLRNQTRSGRMVLNRGNLDWDTIHPLLLQRANHAVSAGLQLSDIVASAFFRACDQYNTLDCNPLFARLLRDRMGRDPDKKRGLISEYGLKVAPAFQPDNWLPVQAQIFRDMGYPKEWWAPVPSNPQYFK